jgi:hypothetical protein
MLYRYLFILFILKVPLKPYLSELYQLIWQEGVEVALSIVPQQEMADCFYLPLTRLVLKGQCHEMVI